MHKEVAKICRVQNENKDVLYKGRGEVYMNKLNNTNNSKGMTTMEILALVNLIFTILTYLNDL